MTDLATVRLVIRLLGAVAAALVLGALALTWLLVTQAGKAGAADPSAVGAVGAVWTMAGTVIGALASLLVSTRSGSTEPVPVVVANEVDNAVPVEDLGAAGG